MNKQNLVLAISLLAMVGLVVGTFLAGGSLAQKILFLVGASTLAFSAYVNSQKMFLVLEIVVSLSAILAFWSVAPLIKYFIFMGASLVGVIYLLKINYSREDKWWPIGGLGLILLAAGFATDAISHPLLFNAFLGVGGILMVLYSAINLFVLKVKIATIWLILNVFFSINPLIIVFSSFFQK